MKIWFPAATANEPFASQIESVIGFGVRLHGWAQSVQRISSRYQGEGKSWADLRCDLDLEDRVPVRAILLDVAHPLLGE